MRWGQNRSGTEPNATKWLQNSTETGIQKQKQEKDKSWILRNCGKRSEMG